MIGGTRKRVKKLVCAGIVTLALAGWVREARAESHQNYFPLNVGNSWTYVDCNDGSTKTFTIIGKEEIHGHTYYRFDSYFAMLDFPGHFPGDDILFRYDPNSDKVFEWCPIIIKEEVRYDFSGHMWGCGNVLIETGVSYTVPAGQFDNCCKFWYGQMCDGGEFYETLAPGVGNIRHEAITYNENFELQSYRIVPYCGDPDHPYPVGDLNHDCRVNLLDLAILAGNWLAGTEPECGVQVTDVKIIRGELVEGRFQEIEEVEKLIVGDVFIIYVNVYNFGDVTEHVFGCGYSWDFSPQNHVEVIGSSCPPGGGICEIRPGESTVLAPFCSLRAFKSEQKGLVTMDIYVKDWVNDKLCEYTFTFDVLASK